MGKIATEAFLVVFYTGIVIRSEEHTSELQSLAYLVCRLLLEKKKKSTLFPLINSTASDRHSITAASYSTAAAVPPARLSTKGCPRTPSRQRLRNAKGVCFMPS